MNVQSANKTHLSIVFVASELAPFSKFGGVGDVAWALPSALHALGHTVRIVTPKYASIDEKKFGLVKYKEGLTIKTEKAEIISNVKTANLPGGIEVYFIENMEYYELRANFYGYKDDARRFALLSKATLELVKSEDWHVDVIHANDWMTGYVPNYLKVEYKDDPKLNTIASVFTIHNLAYQGINKRELKQSDIDTGTGPLPDLYDDKILYVNGVLRGVMYSDYISTVSDAYAREILTPEYGEGLNKVLQEMRNKLVGIRNGIDYSILSPDIDKNIYVNYDIHTLDKRVQNKLAFQKEFNLEINPDIPLVGFVGRFSEQKGLGLFHDTIEPLLKNINFQFAIVGGGEDYWEKFFEKLMKKYPKRVGGYLMISTTFGQRLYASCDILLHPSKFEPCGIAHAIAMHFGAVPVVRKTGGLIDSVIDYNADPVHGDGYMFEEFDEMAFLIQVVNALAMYRSNKKEWAKIQHRAMKKDLSWTLSAVKYVDLYHKAIDRHNKWMKKEGIILADSPIEVPGYSSIDILS